MSTDCTKCPLRTREMFEPLSEAEVAFMLRFRRGELTVEPGAEFLSQGMSSPQLYTVLSGMGVRARSLPDGRRQVIGFVLPGDFVGLQASVMEEMTYAVEATTMMRLCVFTRTDLWSLFTDRPERGFDIAHLASIEEVLLSEALTAVGQLSARERLAWALGRFYTRLKALGMEDRAGRVPLPYRQVDLADAIGLSLVHTNKTLARLRDDRVVTWAGGWLEVHDADALFREGHIDSTATLRRPLI